MLHTIGLILAFAAFLGLLFHAVYPLPYRVSRQIGEVFSALRSLAVPSACFCVVAGFGAFGVTNAASAVLWLSFVCSLFVGHHYHTVLAPEWDQALDESRTKVKDLKRDIHGWSVRYLKQCVVSDDLRAELVTHEIIASNRDERIAQQSGEIQDLRDALMAVDLGSIAVSVHDVASELSYTVSQWRGVMGALQADAGILSPSDVAGEVSRVEAETVARTRRIDHLRGLLRDCVPYLPPGAERTQAIREGSSIG